MNERRGFTLIELLVVIAIIALLMAILMPSLQRAKKKTKEVMCQNNLKQWGVIFSMYTDENNGKFPLRKHDSGRWMDAMVDYYITTEDIRLCPLVKKLANPGGVPGIDWWGNTFIGWGEIPPWDAGGGRTEGFYGSYGVNGYIYVPGENGSTYGKSNGRYWKSPNVKGAAYIPMFLDCYFWCGWPDDDDTPPLYDGWQKRGDEDAMNRFCINRHDGNINANFMDYHVQKVGLKQLWTLNWHRGFNKANQWTIAGGATPEKWAAHGDGWMARFRDY